MTMVMIIVMMTINIDDKNDIIVFIIVKSNDIGHTLHMKIYSLIQ